MPEPEDEPNISETEYEKIGKLFAKYVEFPEFEGADLAKGYFCASCIYFWEGHDDCAIVYSRGESVEGQTSNRIAPYAMCALWKPNWDAIKSPQRNGSKEGE